MDTVQSYLKENPVEIRGLTGITDPSEINRTYNAQHRNAYRSGGFVSPTAGVTTEDNDLDLPPAEYLEKLNDEVYSTVGPSAFNTEESNYERDRHSYISSQTPLSHTVRRDSLNRRLIGYGFNLESPENFALAAGVLNLKPEEVEEIRNGEVAISTTQARSLYEAQVSRADTLISERTDNAPLRANQRMVLTAMAIHNPELIGPDLTKAIKDGDADGAINEIRNRSNASKSRELRIRRVQDAQHFSNYMPEGETADAELGVRMGIRPQPRPTSAPETSLRPQARPTSAPETSLRPQARPTSAPQSVYEEGAITTTPLLPGTGKTLDEIIGTDAAPETSLRPKARPTSAPETSLRPQARPTYAPETSLRPQARIAIAKDETFVNPNPVDLEELEKQGVQTVRDRFGGIAAAAWSGYNSAAAKVIELAGGDGSSSIHYYDSDAYREAAAAGQIDAGTGVIIGEDTGNGQDDYTAFTHIDGDSAPAIAAEETPEFYEALALRPGIRMGEPVELSLVEGGILDTVAEALTNSGDESGFVPQFPGDVPEGTEGTLLQERLQSMSNSVQRLFELADTVPGRLAIQDVITPDFLKGNLTIDASNINSEMLEGLRELARSNGAGKVDYSHYQAIGAGSIKVRGNDGPDLMASDSPLSVADQLQYSFGEAMIVKEGGEYFLTDQHDWNVYVDYTVNGDDGKTYTSEQFESSNLSVAEELLKTIQSGRSMFDIAHNIAFLLGSRDYKDDGRDVGRRIRIPLGKLD